MRVRLEMRGKNKDKSEKEILFRRRENKYI